MVTVRPAQPADAAAVAAVHVGSWQAAYRGLVPDAYLDALQPRDRQGRYRFGVEDADAPATLVAVEDDAVLGFATTGPARGGEGDSCGELLALYLDPVAWDRGIGRLLMAEARAALSRRFAVAVLWVLKGNSRAERFYRADGWAPDGRGRTEVVWGIAIDEIAYRRPLP